MLKQLQSLLAGIGERADLNGIASSSQIRSLLGTGQKETTSEKGFIRKCKKFATKANMIEPNTCELLKGNLFQLIQTSASEVKLYAPTGKEARAQGLVCILEWPNKSPGLNLTENLGHDLKITIYHKAEFNVAVH